MTTLLLPLVLGQAGWVSVAPKGEIFTAKMPIAPKVSRRQVGDAAHKADLRLYQAVKGGAVYIVSVVRPTGTLSVADWKDLGNGFGRGFMRNSGMKEVLRASGKMGKYSGERVAFEGKGLRGEYRTIRVGDELLLLTLAVPAAQFKTASAAFFNNVKIP